MGEIASWFFVEYDEEKIYIKKPHGIQEILWEDIIRVCYKPWSYWMSDEIYIFTTLREESYVIPTESLGGAELWGEIVKRGLFDPDLGRTVMDKKEGSLHCWPYEEE